MLDVFNVELKEVYMNVVAESDDAGILMLLAVHHFKQKVYTFPQS